MSNFKHSFFRTLLYAQLLSGFSGVAIAAQISLSVKDRPMREVIKELEENWEQIGGKFDENLKNLFKSV